jgi:uncharacterized protein YjaZ
MKIHFADSEFWSAIGSEFRESYRNEVREAYKEAAKLLPFGSRYLNFFVQPREYELIAETEDAARTSNSELITLAFSPIAAQKRPQKILRHIRPTVFHEMNHAARFNIPLFHKTFLEMAIFEGLATVFERDFGGAQPLWGKYPSEVGEWLEEIQAEDFQGEWGEYLYRHPDGRRWILYKVGTYIVDQATLQSGKSVNGLSKLPCEQIMELAGI